MLLHFPTIYKNEILHSALARYHVRSGHIIMKHSSEELSVNPNKMKNTDLPTNLKVLSKKIPNNLYTADYLIENHTHYRYYTAFNFKNRESIRDLIKSDGENLTFNAGGLKINKILRHCGECIKSDLKEFGETYFHIEHQLPGVWICLKHKRNLITVKEHITSRIDKNYISANDKDIYNYEERFESKYKSILLSIARLSVAIQDNVVYKNLNKNIIFKNALIKFGYTSYSSRKVVNKKLLHKDFTSYYPTDFLESMGLKLTGKYYFWLFDLYSQKENTQHTLKHILFINFLFRSNESFINFATNHSKEIIDKNIFDFGPGPWTCINPVHKEQNDKSVVLKKILTSKDSVCGTFECECGYVHTRKITDQGIKISNILNYGPLWEKELIKLFNQGFSINAISIRLNVAHKTIEKYTNYLNLELEGSRKNLKDTFYTRERSSEEILSEKREKWREYINKYGYVNSTMDKNLYNWLNNNDKEWLRSNYPKNPNKNYRSKGFKKNWIGIDSELVGELKNINENWSQLEFNRHPLKKTKISFARLTNYMYAITHNEYKKIPKSLDYINSITENTTQFRARKLYWALNEMKQEKEAFTFREIMMKAHISDKKGYTQAKKLLHTYFHSE